MPNTLFPDQSNFCYADDEPSSGYYNALLILIGVTTAAIALARAAESKNHLTYESRIARIVAGFLMLLTGIGHTSKKNDGMPMLNTKKSVIVMGPHRTGWEGLAVAAKLEGPPPRFFATDKYNTIPGVSTFMSMFQAIPVKENAAKGTHGRSANADALDTAASVLANNGCVALFPQGNFSKIDKKPHRVYPGAAKLAVAGKVPVRVIRLDGFWCLDNPFIPLAIRNNDYYRALLSWFHVNNLRITLCYEIDFHLKSENQNLSEEEQIREINAQIYAFYRHTRELKPNEIDDVKVEISNKTHLMIWDNKVKQDDLGKQLFNLEKEAAQLGWESARSS